MEDGIQCRYIPDDVVANHILCHIKDINTRICFGAVCRSWRAILKNAPPLTPAYAYLVNYDPVADSGTSHHQPSLFDPISMTSKRLPRPSKTIYESGIAGYHAPYMAYTPDHPIIDFKNWRCKPVPEPPSLLYNPFSGRTLAQLPLTCRYPDGQRKPISFPLGMVRFYSPHPSSARPSLVAAITIFTSSILICHMPVDGDENDDEEGEWVVSAPIDDNDEEDIICDFVFYKDELYCVSREGHVYAMDLHRHTLPNGVITCPTPRLVYHHQRSIANRRKFAQHNVSYTLLVSNEELLFITQYDVVRFEIDQKEVFEVHRLDLDKRIREVVKELPNTILFLGEGCSCSVSWHGSEPDHPFFRKNYIYFFDQFSPDAWEKPNAPGFLRIGRFPIGGNTYAAEFLPYILPTELPPFWITYL